MKIPTQSLAATVALVTPGAHLSNPVSKFKRITDRPLGGSRYRTGFYHSLQPTIYTQPHTGASSKTAFGSPTIDLHRVAPQKHRATRKPRARRLGQVLDHLHLQGDQVRRALEASGARDRGCVDRSLWILVRFGRLFGSEERSRTSGMST